jgi:hypothetical protein
MLQQPDGVAQSSSRNQSSGCAATESGSLKPHPSLPSRPSLPTCASQSQNHRRVGDSGRSSLEGRPKPPKLGSNLSSKFAPRVDFLAELEKCGLCLCRRRSGARGAVNWGMRQPTSPEHRLGTCTRPAPLGWEGSRGTQ